MTPEQIQMVQTSWRSVLPVGDTFAEIFYGKLFSLDAGMAKLFKGDMKDQGRSLTAMMSVAVGSLSKPERITVAVRQLGKRHVAYGVQPRHYDLVETALMFALEHALIDVWSEELSAAWGAVYAMLAATMREGAHGPRPGVAA